jgi:DNA-binding NarL/FixJ family response regulator
VLSLLGKQRRQPKTVIYSGMSSDFITLEAFTRGVNAFVDKRESLEYLLTTLQRVAEGDFPLTPHQSDLLREAVRRQRRNMTLSAKDLAVLRMSASTETTGTISNALNMSPWGVYKSRSRTLSRLRHPDGPSPLQHFAISLGLIDRL